MQLARVVVCVLVLVDVICVMIVVLIAHVVVVAVAIFCSGRCALYVGRVEEHVGAGGSRFSESILERWHCAIASQ